MISKAISSSGHRTTTQRSKEFDEGNDDERSNIDCSQKPFIVIKIHSFTFTLTRSSVSSTTVVIYRLSD
jgi:hypothetical protein